MANSNNTTQAFWVAAGKLSSMAVGVGSAMILSRYFGKEEYGTYKQIVYVYTTLLVIFSAGLPRVFAYFLPRHSKEEGKSIVFKISALLLGFGAVFSLFLYFGSSQIAQLLDNPSLDYGLKIFSPIPLLLLPTLGIEGIFSTYKKTVYIAIYNTVSRLLTVGFIVLPIIFIENNYEYAIYGWVVASVLTFFMALYFKSIPFKKIDSKKANLQLKEIFAYSLPLVYASLWAIVLKSANEFFISRYYGAAVFANFSNGFIELPFVKMVTGSTAVVLMPIFSKSFHEQKDDNAILSTWQSALKKSALIIYPLTVFFIVYGTEVMMILYGHRYAVSGTYFRINLFLHFFNIVIFAPLFFAMGKTKLYAKLHMFMALLIWGVDFILVYTIDTPIAIAINSTVINIVKILIFLYLASKLLKIKFFHIFPLKSLSIIFLHAAVMAAITFGISRFIHLSDAILPNIAIYAAIYGGLILATARIFKLDYFGVIKPITNRIFRK